MKPGDRPESSPDGKAAKDVRKTLDSAESKGMRELKHEVRKMKSATRGNEERRREYEARQLAAKTKDVGAKPGAEKIEPRRDIQAQRFGPPGEKQRPGDFELRGLKQKPLSMKDLEQEVRRMRANPAKRVASDKTDGRLPAADEQKFLERQQQIYSELQARSVSGRIEFRNAGLRHVHERDVLSPRYTDKDWNTDSPKFWQHHGNDRQFYERMAQRYPALQREVEAGRDIEALKADPEFKESAGFWYSDSDRLKLTEYKATHFCDVSGKHRVELAKQHKLGTIPAWVTEARERES